MTLLIKKFNYEEIKKESVNGKRLYACPDGNSVASVTIILDKTKDKTSLIEWRKRVGETKANEIATEAASIGTRMHKFLEDYVETGNWPSAGSNPYSQQANKMATTIKDKALSKIDEIWGSEVQLYHPKIYAGTTDLVGVFNGAESIMDFKQTNKPKKEEWVEDYKLQLTAYALAHNEVYGTDINAGLIFIVSHSGEYQQFLVEKAEFRKYNDMWLDKVEQFYKIAK